MFDCIQRFVDSDTTQENDIYFLFARMNILMALDELCRDRSIWHMVHSNYCFGNKA